VHGHGIGDELLIVAAQRLLSAVRDGVQDLRAWPAEVSEWQGFRAV
jgi:hypothetical protein